MSLLTGIQEHILPLLGTDFRAHKHSLTILARHKSDYRFCLVPIVIGLFCRSCHVEVGDSSKESNYAQERSNISNS